jgi:hypothetical protein
MIGIRIFQMEVMLLQKFVQHADSHYLAKFHDKWAIHLEVTVFFECEDGGYHQLGICGRKF